MIKKDWAAIMGAWMDRWKYDTVARFFLFIGLLGFLYALTLNDVVPEKYEFELNQSSPSSIKSPRSFIDVEATEEARHKAGLAIEEQFTRNDQITQQQLKQIDAIFRSVESVVFDDQFSQEQKVGLLKSMIPYDLSEAAYYKWVRIQEDQLLDLKTTARRILQEIMSQGVKSDELVEARNQVNAMLVSSDLDKNERELILELTRASITQNLFVDKEKTDELRTLAQERVAPFYIDKDQVLVVEGEKITPEVMERLKAAGLLKNQISYLPHLGLFLLLSVLVILLHLYIRQSHLEIRYNNLQLLMLVIVYILNGISMKVLSIGQDLEYPMIGYVAPVAFGSLLLTILLDHRIGFFSSIVFSTLASLIFTTETGAIFDYRFGIVALLSCLVSVFAISHDRHRRSELLRVCLFISITVAVSVLSIQWMIDVSTWTSVFYALAVGMVNGLLTAILTMGLLPLFETAFGMISSMKLIELSSPNHPLLRKLLIETPGTYHHSVMVGNLSEAAAEAIGANGLLCRVGSFYHDLGKTIRPSFFIENQMGMTNPHDRLDPSLSASIIIAHPRDGSTLLKQHRIPKAIRDIAEQHHGTTLLKFFYHKAQSQAPEGVKVLEADYRYPGPKAQTKEAAIVGIADCVEAAIRSLSNPTPEQIESIVRSIVKNRLEDGQLNECDLTLRELEQVTLSIGETLMGIFHSRIEYPPETELKGVRHA
jgi:putative nucleotidyltransferase with HDIG domain